MKSATLDAEGITGRGAGIRKKSLTWGEITYAAWGGEWVNLRGQEDDSGKAPVVQVDAKVFNAVAIPAPGCSARGTASGAYATATS